MVLEYSSEYIFLHAIKQIISNLTHILEDEDTAIFAA